MKRTRKKTSRDELVGAGLERVDEDLQAGGVARQLEQPHDADDAEELENVVFLLQPRQEEVEVEGQRGDEVDYVDRRPHEVALVRADDESYEQLDREPGVAGTFEDEEGSVRFGHPPVGHVEAIVDWASARHGGQVELDGVERGIAQDRNTHGRMGLEAEGQYRNDDEED